jgi:hypothetical protein
MTHARKKKSRSKPELPTEGSTGPTFQFTSLTQQDRTDIVESSGAPGQPGNAYVPAKLFQLTALGANLDLTGQWEPVVTLPGTPPYGGNLAQWRQITTSGRDQYVRIVRRGYLFPLGIRAVFIQIVERVFVLDPVGGRAFARAYLQEKQYIKIMEPLKAYPALGEPFAARSWPFPLVAAQTILSPPLDQVQPELLTSQAIMPSSGGADVIWTFRVADASGHRTTLNLPQAFVFGEGGDGDDQDPHDSGFATKLQAAYNALPAGRRTSAVPGNRLQYAPEAGGATGVTSHPTLSITMVGATSINDPNTSTAPSSPPSTADLTAVDQPAFYPAIATAAIKLPAAEALSRTAATDGSPINYFDEYIASGFQAGLSATNPPHGGINPGGVYAALTPVIDLNIPADAVGGLANPDTELTGLSATAGVIAGDLTMYADTGKMSIAEYFGSAEAALAQLLGGLLLFDIAGGILKDFDNDLGVPEIKTQYDDVTGVHTILYILSASLQPWSQGGNLVFQPVDSSGNPTTNGTLKLKTTITVDSTGNATYETSGAMTPFEVYLLGKDNALYFIKIPIKGITFSASGGNKPDVNVKVGSVEFEGVLEFINALQKFLKDIGGSGLSIDVKPTQIQASLAIALPSLSFGVFSLENMSLSAAVTIPFLGAPTIATFGFCSQEKPFSLTVCMFGGGGYVLLGLGMNSVQSVTASIDFEGQLGLDLVVASGSVSVRAGITYSYVNGTGTTLTAFIDIKGEVEVLGIISITLELDLSLSYVAPVNGSSYLEGTATMKASISICFFSASVSITVTKKFGNNDSSSASASIESDTEVRQLAAAAASTGGWDSPATTFASIMTNQSHWSGYCAAFAS